MALTWTKTDAPAIAAVAFSGPTATFTGVAIGTASATRLVVVLVSIGTSSGFAVTGVTVTIGGVTATEAVRHSDNQTTTGIWYANVTSGTTATITVTTLGSGAVINLCGITVGALEGATPTPTSTAYKVWNYDPDPQVTTTALTVPSGGIGLVVLGTENATSAPTWNVGTQDYVTGGGSYGASIASGYISASGSQTPSISNVAYQGTGISAATWAPASGGYIAQGVTFDGTNDYMSAASLTGVADGKAGIISVWIKINGSNASYQFILENTAQNFQFYRRNDGVIGGVGNNAAGTAILAFASTNTLSSPMGWTHVIWSWNLATGYNAMYINDVAETAGLLTTTNDTIDYAPTTTSWTFGTRGAGALILNADMADFYFNPTTSLDLSVTGNRRKFIDASGNPVDLGSDGSIPTGTAPLIFLHGPTASWHINDGTGGGFTLTGALTDAPTNPPGAPAGGGLIGSGILGSKLLSRPALVG